MRAFKKNFILCLSSFFFVFQVLLVYCRDSFPKESRYCMFSILSYTCFRSRGIVVAWLVPGKSRMPLLLKLGNNLFEVRMMDGAQTTILTQVYRFTIVFAFSLSPYHFLQLLLKAGNFTYEIFAEMNSISINIKFNSNWRPPCKNTTPNLWALAHWPYTEKICHLKSHRLCIILVDRLESRLNIMSLLIEEYDR